MKKKPPGGNFEGWFEVLEVCRRIGKDQRPITSVDLLHAARFKGTEDTKASQIASGWLGKFARWGYLERAGTQPRAGEPGPPLTIYVVSKAGWEAYERPGKLTILVRAIRLHQKACAGQNVENVYASLSSLVQWCDLIESNTLTNEQADEFQKIWERSK